MTQIQHILATFILLLCGVSMVVGQQDHEELYIYNNDLINDVPNRYKDINNANSKSPEKKQRVNINIGTSYLRLSDGASLLNTYTAISVSNRITDKFDLTAGLMLSNVNANFFRSEGYRYNGLGTYAFAEGTYYLNNKITLSGAFLKRLDTTPQTQTLFEQRKDAGYFNLHYKLSENASLNFGFSVNERRNPYNSFYNEPFSPFYY